ncbi:flagellar protein FlgN [Alkalihalobacillus pseudalcaliphilus]|uniref:flagellar protein FlgN n=1 Tax=Alkalihalobacillus pseudalcaliphilus TaxID=79884 RepID=UPI00069F4AB9|nr:flagellar protein FlgN [Alkalihalobacillus pseudalcaliphilus]
MSLTKVKNVLHELVEIHQKLLKLAIKKTDYIKKNEMKSLEQLVREETKWAQRLKVAEMVRMREVQAFLEGVNKPLLNPTMKDVLGTVGKEEAAELMQLQEQLLPLIIEMKRVNDHNKELLEESMSYIQLSMDLLSPQLTDMQYQRNQEAIPTYDNHTRSIFDSKA